MTLLSDWKRYKAGSIVSQYPPQDIEGVAHPQAQSFEGARIAAVAPDTPAYDAGFEPGCVLTAIDGQPLRDIIDWRWLSDDDEMEVSYIDLDGDRGTAALWREQGEDWGFEFDGIVFDGVRQCRNACTFCFMHQLPHGMRPSLYLRDDDFRLSFIAGTFITCTNLTPEDELRIVEQHISPLRVSLQASNPEVRRRLIGKHEQHGREALERLLAAGVEFHAQIVLVPGENDGDALRETLTWAYQHPGILNIGIVPLGYTCHQTRFHHSFNDEHDSRALLALIEPFQERALEERGSAWVFAADEFYRNAYRDDLLFHIPPASHYGSYELFEDGIGMIRVTMDEWEAAERSGLIDGCAQAARASSKHVHLVVGYAQEEFLDPLIERSCIGEWFKPLYVANNYFGGNVDVTGLLTGSDIVEAVRDSGDATSPDPTRTDNADIIVIPKVIFNDDGLTLDDKTLQDMEKEAARTLHMVSCSPLDYFREIADLARGAG